LVRGQAAEALAGRINYDHGRRPVRSRDLRARAAFERGLSDPAPEVRLWSIFALAQQGNEWVIPKLELMRHDTALVPRMWTVGQEASWAIDWIRERNLDRNPTDY
jgi:hypothetical protein